MIIIAVDVLKS